MTNDHSLSCKDLVELVTDYFEGALAPADHLRFEVHIAACRGCDSFLLQMRQTVTLLGSLPEASVDPAARETLLTIFRDWRGGAGQT